MATRKILFRGKDEENGKWVVGFYSEMIFSPFTRQVEYYPHIQEEGTCRCRRIDTDTVGQFTGVYDKKYGCIYEGDVLEMNGIVVAVKYIRAMGQYACCDVDGSVLFGLNTTDEEYRMANARIIGNIYDSMEYDFYTV